ncbi:glycosyltransferase family 39 protein [Candidatus Daviesbacteria bacterium]|nr:glycosyltransferase family 39 protein [Candidatus Daviesbacteria bacterium]
MNNRINLNSPIFKILLIFLTWRLILILVLFFAVNIVPLGSADRFLGGGSVNYSISPELFAWANFDGEHYLSIAIFGYKQLEQAFFPLYPLLISFFSNPDPSDLLTSLINSTIAGLFISNISFALALIFLWELIKIDFSKKIAYWVIILLLIFPTSFYFGAVYNESLFLLLSVLSFYSARKGNWLAAGLFGAVASSTRVFGAFLLPALLIEAWQQKTPFFRLSWVFLIPFGLVIYMGYLKATNGDPFAFYNLQTLVGEQHQRGIVFLPQVYFRYIKMLATTSMQNPIFQTLILEFAVGLLFFILPIYGYFKKIRLSYVLYALIGFLVPAIQGSFSSSPRYVIILFPAFLAAALWVNGLSKIAKVIILVSSFSALIVEATLFLRGYWVA